MSFRESAIKLSRDVRASLPFQFSELILAVTLFTVGFGQKEDLTNSLTATGFGVLFLGDYITRVFNNVINVEHKSIPNPRGLLGHLVDGNLFRVKK